MSKAWLNGALVVEKQTLSRAIAYGDGLFETMRVHNGRVLFQQQHIERIVRSCKKLQIPVDQQELQQSLDQVVTSLVNEEKKSAVIKMIVSRGDSGRGYRAPLEVKAEILLTVSSWQENTVNQEGVELELSDYRLPENASLAGIKHLNRLDQVMASLDWKSQIAERLLLSVSGRVIEGTFSNLFLLKNNSIITPRLNLAGVRGVGRQVVIERVKDLGGYELMVRDVNLADLKDAEEIFLCNSVFGIWPVLKLGLWTWQKGKLTTSLQQWFSQELNTNKN